MSGWKEKQIWQALIVQTWRTMKTRSMVEIARFFFAGTSLSLLLDTTGTSGSSYMVFTTEGLSEVAIESWPEWDLNPRPLNSVQTL